MCDINEAFGSSFNLDLSFKFDIVVTYNEGTKHYMGVVTMNNTTEGFSYRVFPGNIPDNRFLYQTTQCAVIEGTVTGTNNNSFTFPIGSCLEKDFFVLVSPLAAPNASKLAVNELPPGTVDLRDLSKSKTGKNWNTTFKETFAIFYPKRVLKARKLESRKTASFTLKSESTRSNPGSKVMTDEQIKEAVAASKAMNADRMETQDPTWKFATLDALPPFSDFKPFGDFIPPFPVMPYDQWCEMTPNFGGSPESTSKQSPFP